MDKDRMYSAKPLSKYLQILLQAKLENQNLFAINTL